MEPTIMKQHLKILTLFFVFVLCLNIGLAQTNQFVVLPVGTSFEARINMTISSSKSHNGEKFELEVVNPVLANGTDVIIPQGSKVVGEVVEAIPSSKVPREKGDPKPNGKLQIQLNNIITPNGITYPVVASIIGETSSMGAMSQANPNLGASVGYVGSQHTLNSLKPGANSQFMMNRIPGGQNLVTRKDISSDPVYGGQSNIPGMAQFQKSKIRALQLKNHELYIMAGSPVNIKLDTPLKIPYGKIENVTNSSTQSDKVNTDFGSAKHFTSGASEQANQNSNTTSAPNSNPDLNSLFINPNIPQNSNNQNPF